MAGHLLLRSGLLLAAALSLAAAACSNTSTSSSSDGGLACTLGGSCSQTQVCTGGIAGCTSNCQCLGGTWQAPCPATMPQTGSACAPAGAECGYTTSTNACGAANCYCQAGAWSCEPTCIVVDASVDEADVNVSGSCVDAAPAQNCTAANIHASSYDQTCQMNSDCVLVVEGYACASCSACAPSSAINRSAVSQYEADVAKIVGPTTGGGGGCAPCCGPSPVACCRGGQCHADNACLPVDGSTGAADAGESGAGRVPVNHRPSDAQCSTTASPGDCAGPYPDGGGCASDSDCTEAGTNGRCINPGGGPAAPCFCTYDKCLGDSDCPGGQTCACHGAPYTDSAGNECVKGNCRIDADCGAKGYCSPSSRTGICGDSLGGYYCHTAADLCIDDSDCPQSATVVGSPGCVYSTTNSRWECLVVPVCL